MAPIHRAALDGNPVEVKRLIAEAPPLVKAPDGDGDAPLNLAARKGHLAVVKCLLDHGARINQISQRIFPMTPLQSASFSGQVEVVKLLMERGADPSITEKYGLTPLQRACWDGQLAVVRCLVSRGGDHIDQSDALGHTPLLGAVNGGHTEVVRVLLQVGADPCIPLNFTPLKSAMLNGSLDCIALLEVSESICWPSQGL